jgi:hypothetical protein
LALFVPLLVSRLFNKCKNLTSKKKPQLITVAFLVLTDR